MGNIILDAFLVCCGFATDKNEQNEDNNGSAYLSGKNIKELSKSEEYKLTNFEENWNINNKKLINSKTQPQGFQHNSDAQPKKDFKKTEHANTFSERGQSNPIHANSRVLPTQNKKPLKMEKDISSKAQDPSTRNEEIIAEKPLNSLVSQNNKINQSSTILHEQNVINKKKIEDSQLNNWTFKKNEEIQQLPITDQFMETNEKLVETCKQPSQVKETLRELSNQITKNNTNLQEIQNNDLVAKKNKKTSETEEIKQINQENNQYPTEIKETKANLKRPNSEITIQEEADSDSQKKVRRTEEPENKTKQVENVVNEELNDEQAEILEIIRVVEEEVQTTLEPQVKKFNGILGAKEYFILDEHLLQSLEKLDKLNVKPYPEIREKRKILIKKIHQLMDELDENAIDDD